MNVMIDFVGHIIGGRRTERVWGVILVIHKIGMMVLKAVDDFVIVDKMLRLLMMRTICTCRGRCQIVMLRRQRRRIGGISIVHLVPANRRLLVMMMMVMNRR